MLEFYLYKFVEDRGVYGIMLYKPAVTIILPINDCMAFKFIVRGRLTRGWRSCEWASRFLLSEVVDILAFPRTLACANR